MAVVYFVFQRESLIFDEQNLLAGSILNINLGGQHMLNPFSCNPASFTAIVRPMIEWVPKISWIWSFSGVWCTCGKKHLSGPCYWWRTSENLSHFTIFVFVWTMFGMLIFCFPQNNFLFVNMGTFFFSGIKTFHFIPHIWCGGIKDSGQGIVPFYSENFTVGVCLHSWEYNENYF